MNSSTEQQTSIRELNQTEINQVSGGVVPVLGMVVSAIGHFGARTALSSFAGRIGFGIGVYELARWIDDK